MKTLYLDLSMGAAGDMLTAALLELFDDREAVLEGLRALGVPGVEFTALPSQKCGITGTHMSVLVSGEEESEALHADAHSDHAHAHEYGHDHAHHHPHRHLSDVEAIINGLHAPKKVLSDAVAVYRLIAEAESAVHGESVSEIHFHEVGTLDAIADVTAVCYLLHLLSPDKIIASPVHIGSGTVRCAHGVLPVPAPATALLLTGIPTYGGEIGGELCTPTGAALLKYFVDAFAPQPVMAVEKIGYGMGKKDFPRANCVRAFLGQTADAQGDRVWELQCNLDDMTPEALAFAAEQLLSAGALDVFLTPILMKKGRPGTLLTVLCRPEDRERIVKEVFRHTTTLGVRMTEKTRATLERRETSESTPFGAVRQKISEGFGVRREKYEYDDLAALAKDRDLSLSDVETLLK